ncbi:MAG: glutamyl-tRNA reductase [Firmicutes bacterium]|nr:glutamyl-tRNA reductase [Bacillota bacterium]
MYTISVSHKTAPLSLRSTFSFTKNEAEEFISTVVSKKAVTECVVLSTCNRMEIYFDGTCSIDEMLKFLCCFKGVETSGVMKYFNIFSGNQAVHHIFKVACGIDSMVLGEDEILGQVKGAFQTSLNMNATGFCFNTVFRNAIAAAKKVKTSTAVSKTPVSMGTLTANAVSAWKEGNKNVLIIGISGKIGSIAAKNILAKDNVSVVGTLRRHNAPNLVAPAHSRVEFVEYSRRYECVENADVIISATSSPHYTVTADEYSRSLKTQKKRLLIDLAVPNDIDPAVGNLSGTTLFNVDHFESLSKQNNLRKQKEAETAEAMIDKLTDETLKELTFHSFLPHMHEMKKYFAENTIEKAFYKFRKELTNDEMTAVVSAFKKLVKE